MQIRKILSIHIILHLFFYPSISFFLTNNQSIDVFHINGVNTSRRDAIQNLKQLHDLANVRSNFIKWNLLYNQTHGLLASDLWDVFRQKRQENRNLTIDDYVAVYMKANHLSYIKGSKKYQELKENIKDAYAEDIGYVGKNFADIHNQFHSVVDEMYVNLKTVMQIEDPKNTYILFIPHSQGCLYANSLRELEVSSENKQNIGMPKENIEIFAIASPSDKVSMIGNADDKQKKYITADNDFVINALRAFSLFSPVSNQPMPATIHLTKCNDTMLCHSLTDAYLADKNASLIISKKIKEGVKISL